MIRGKEIAIGRELCMCITLYVLRFKCRGFRIVFGIGVAGKIENMVGVNNTYYFRKEG